MTLIICDEWEGNLTMIRAIYNINGLVKNKRYEVIQEMANSYMIELEEDLIVCLCKSIFEKI